MGSGHPVGVAFDATPGDWEASDVRSSRKECDEEYRSALVMALETTKELENPLKELIAGCRASGSIGLPNRRPRLTN